MPPQEELQSIYNQYGSTISSVARHYNTSNPTVRKWLNNYNIPRKSQKKASTEANNRQRVVIPDPKELEYNYHTTRTIKDMENIYGVGQDTIYLWLDSCGIPLRTKSESSTLGKKHQYANIQFTNEELEKEYVNCYNLRVMASKFDVSYSHMRKLFRDYNIEVFSPTRSQKEVELFERCQSILGIVEVSASNRKIINPYELDIVIPKFNLAIEYCGSYWHSQGFGQKESRYHQEKWKMCKESGYNLITIFEGDSFQKVESLIQTLCRKNDRVYARNTIIQQIPPTEATVFHNTHHLHGACGAAIHLGAYYNDELIMVLSMGHSRFNDNYQYECVRMTSHSLYSVVGGASKLFAHFRKCYKPKSIITFADLRFGQGRVYENCGFTMDRITKPNYWYFHKDRPAKLFSRVKFQKHKLVKRFSGNFDSNLTEYENMKMNGWDRIYDCGNGVYVSEGSS